MDCVIPFAAMLFTYFSNGIKTIDVIKVYIKTFQSIVTLLNPSFCNDLFLRFVIVYIFAISRTSLLRDFLTEEHSVPFMQIKNLYDSIFGRNRTVNSPVRLSGQAILPDQETYSPSRQHIHW